MSKTDGKWFSHDNNTATAPKIVCLEAEYGFEGYGRFWRLLEIIHTQEGYKYNLGMKVAYASLAKMLGYTTEQLKSFLHFLIHDIELIQTDGDYIWNDSMLERMEYWGQKRQSYSERGKKGAAIKKEMQAKLEENNSLAKAERIEKQANETKPNNTKQNDTTPNNNIVDDVEVFKGNNSNVIQLHNNNAIALQHSPTITELRDICFDDVEFCAPYTQLKKIPHDRLYAWMGAFNKWLIHTADTRKSEQEYRKHFRNWFHQRNLAKETPETYNPVNNAAFSKQPVRPIPMEMPRKTAAQALAEQQAAEAEILRRLGVKGA